jgi:hypothetical protein
VRFDSRGAAAVEMAFVVVLLLWLVLGVVDVGRVILTRLALEDAVHADAASVEAVTIGSTDSITLTGAEIQVACMEVTREPKPASRVRVEVVHTVDYLTPLVGPALGGSIDLHETAEAERFAESCDGLEEVPW